MRSIHFLSLFVVIAVSFLTACKKNDQPSSDHVINSFVLTAAQNKGFTKDIAGVISSDTIKLRVPPGADITKLTPTISYLGITVWPSDGMVRDFSTPVHYTVAAEDGSSHSYVVIVYYQSTDKGDHFFSIAPRRESGTNYNY